MYLLLLRSHKTHKFQGIGSDIKGGELDPDFKGTLENKEGIGQTHGNGVSASRSAACYE